MRIMVEKLLRQHGIDIRMEERTVRGLFQPVTGKLDRLATPEAGPLGMQSRQQYVYIGPAMPSAEEGDAVTVEGRTYWIRRGEQILDGNGPVYCWGMCVEKGGEDTWGQS